MRQRHAPQAQGRHKLLPAQADIQVCRDREYQQLEKNRTQVFPPPRQECPVNRAGKQKQRINHQHQPRGTRRNGILAAQKRLSRNRFSGVPEPSAGEIVSFCMSGRKPPFGKYISHRNIVRPVRQAGRKATRIRHANCDRRDAVRRQRIQQRVVVSATVARAVAVSVEGQPRHQHQRPVRIRKRQGADSPRSAPACRMVPDAGTSRHNPASAGRTDSVPFRHTGRAIRLSSAARAATKAERPARPAWEHTGRSVALSAKAGRTAAPRTEHHRRRHARPASVTPAGQGTAGADASSPRPPPHCAHRPPVALHPLRGDVPAGGFSGWFPRSSGCPNPGTDTPGLLEANTVR